MNIAQIDKGLEIVLNKPVIKRDMPILLNKNLPSKESLGGDASNPNKKDFEAEKDLMIQLSKWFIETTPGFGMGGGNTSAGKKSEKSEEKKEEKEEIKKDNYDLELTAFESGKKIALIKEVRGLTNLGLKEVRKLIFFNSIFI